MSTKLALPDGVKFKAKEQAAAHQLPANTYAVIRFDGKNFSTYTKRYAKPYDLNFMSVMDEVSRKVAATIPGAVLVYTQSDEISVVFSDLASAESQMWFGGRVEKMLTIGAATVTALFMQAVGLDDDGPLPVFDARVHTLADLDEVEEYVRWRRFDAQKNSVTMAASMYHSHKALDAVPSRERLRLLEGTDLERLPDSFYNGRVSFKETFLQDVTEVVKVDGHIRTKRVKHGKAEPLVDGKVLRKRWVSVPATRDFMEQKFRSLFV
jgi:tRNA(His) guanylyltransferase